MIVGTAEVLVVPITKGFEKELKDSTDSAFGSFRSDAEAAGADAGAGLRSGVRKESSKLESDLAAVGSTGGLNLRRGVTEQTGRLAGDVEKDGARAGESLSRGASGGLSKLAGVISATGLPLGGLSTGLERAGSAAEHTGSKASGLGATMDKVGGIAVAGLAGGLLVAAGAGVSVGEKMQSAEASIASAAGTSVKAAASIGSALEGTAGKSEFSGLDMARAYAQVAGQLKATEGRALSTGEAMKVMAASTDLAEAKQIDLGTATSTVSGVMQAFQLKAADAGHVSDVLYQASNATGQSIDTLGTSLEKVRSKLGATAGSVGDLAGLLVDMTDRGITGRAAMAGLNGAMNTLIKSSTGVQTATQNQRAAYDQMSPSLQKLADAYRSGSMTSSEFTKATDALPPKQAELAKAFATSTTAVQTAQIKFREMGITAFDAQGKFVGMGSIIEQLHPKFAKMTQDQQLAAASTLFGASAARQMVQVIDAGPAAYDKATQGVNKMGAAHDAASRQAATLHGEEKTLEAAASDLAGKIGAVLIPILTALVGALTHATTFVLGHKAALIGLAAVVTGILGPAIAVFTINKMAAFGQSFVNAGKNVSNFAGGVQTAVSKVIGLFAKQSAAADVMATDVSVANAKAAGSMAEVDAAAGTEAGAVTAADGTIEGANAAAGASFARLLGPIAAVEAALLALDNAKPVSKAGHVASVTGGPGSPNPGTYVPSPTSGFNLFGIHIPVGAKGGFITQPTLMIAGEAGPEMLIPINDLQEIARQGVPLAGLSMQAAIGQTSAHRTNAARATGGDGASLAGAADTGGGATIHHAGRRRAHHAATASAASAGLPGFSAAQDATARGLFALFTGAGLSKAGAAGLIGNFAQESSLNLNEPGGLLAQWGGSRLVAEHAYAAAHHESPTSLAAEGGFVLQELKGYPGLRAMLQHTNNAAGAALAISNQYERPAAWAANNPNREHQAAEALAAFGGIAGAPTLAQVLAPKKKQLTAAEHRDVQEARQGAGLLAKLVAAVHKDSLGSLDRALQTAHKEHLSSLEHKLDSDHIGVLTDLSKKLVAVHEKAMDDVEKLLAAKALAAEIGALNKADTLMADKAKQSADRIADSTKVFLDKQAQVGLSGAALTAAKAQTSLDRITQRNDVAIDAAQLKVDQAASGSKLAQAQAANQLARAQATATVQEAQAQSVLDKASAAANRSTTTTTTVTNNAAPINLIINGAGLSASQLLAEAAWVVSTGALPVAPPPVAVAA